MTSKGQKYQWMEPEDLHLPEDYQEAVGGNPLVAQVLYRRGLRNLSTVSAFLDPNTYAPQPPEALPDIPQSVERIQRAIQQGEKICVWGDFDVDGQTSTAILVSTLQRLGAKVSYHIPVRARESHGVNVPALQVILQNGVQLLVTCDTGITAHEALHYARQQGVDVIVTDHHALAETLPETYAAVTPRRLPAEHPMGGLPGAGVAYQLAKALLTAAGQAGEVEALLDLVALGIVADLAPLTGDTRYLLQRGLPVLRSTQRVGLQVMMELAGVKPAWLTEEHIGFVLGPRLNALGRLDDANPAVELLTTQDVRRARVLAAQLEGLNARRQLLTQQVLRGALTQIEKDPSLLQQPVLILSHTEWPAGVIGIVASALVERFHRPTVLLATPAGQAAHGSARSIEGVNITEAIGTQQHLLNSFGGHAMAAGLALEPKNLPAFRHGLGRQVAQIVGKAAPLPTLQIDGFVDLKELSLELVNEMERIAPFGAGNPAPVLAVRNLACQSNTPVGREQEHVQIIVQDPDGRQQKVIWWRGASESLPEGRFDLACVVRASNYRGQQEVQVEWVDSRQTVVDEVVVPLPTLSIVDQRGLPHPLTVLRSYLNQEKVIVWGEGEARRLEGARGRDQLIRAETLVVWTTPADQTAFRAALDIVKPREVVLFAIHPTDASTEGFLKRLAGMVKYALEHEIDEVHLQRLASATAQREGTVRKGLLWLEQRGLVKVAFVADGQMQLRPAESVPGSTSEAAALFKQIQILIEETAAYREYFRRVETSQLL